MAKRPTVSDLARASGVSVATVDRVLNNRLPVREETAQRVYEAATVIGYHAVTLIKQRIRQDLPEYRLGFLLQKPEQHFYQEFARELEAATIHAPRFRGIPVIDFWSSQAPEDIVVHLEKLAAKTNAIALVSPDHPTITVAVESLKARGIPVFSLLSDFAPGVREGYVGLNNRKVGRTAAWMIAQCARRPGKVAVFVGSHRFHGQELREIGVRAYFREHAPDFTVLETLVNLETAGLTHQAMLDLLERHPDLVGCYIAGGGMEGAITAVRTAMPAQPPVLICNEITPESRAALANNIITMVLATPLARLSSDLVNLMAHAIQDGAANAPGQTFLPFDIHVPENI
ncbi:LacI family transcriptional regulator [Mesorhizobium sp. WSM4307]|uniref:LacI family DNA-binding transcriptional regulator n=1 Tax=unclassified Mesorhizobium TaxID=325217 RepID=UPI000BB03D87|nr:MULTISPECIES: LacI family DNA-binding transcriptional regulator [unclassified Mesorhizobium]PBB24358.1 LacI family transcriptional regulator [Mesorhizobium sp. WSM4304]PBB74674.1 LacI family transcriptional regulator [Mesorhizobium sp. WSM4308]TRC71667.1 LacI family transcriptional regulator [Mesorhizobium sp. WSM4315]TRC83666.1 LacI family transcriptional regulator [Mesorhizobium sp. WSM4307]